MALKCLIVGLVVATTSVVLLKCPKQVEIERKDFKAKVQRLGWWLLQAKALARPTPIGGHQSRLYNVSCLFLGQRGPQGMPPWRPWGLVGSPGAS